MSAADPGTGAPHGDAHPNLEWLFDLQRFGPKPGLGTTRALLERIGSPQSALRTVLVGGTNGKGSVARLLAACSTAAGRPTGLFVSPHLQRVGERAQLDGSPLDDAEFDALVAEVRPHVEALGATFFEAITAAALLGFARHGAAWAVLEVGLGGRLDATNVVEPELTVITGVALDHTAILGNDVAAIAREKAGILRPGVPLVTGAGGEALPVLEEAARRLGAPLMRLGHEFRADHATMGWDGVRFTLDRTAGLAEPLALASPLVGRHQVGNVAQAAMAAMLLGIEPGTVAHAIAGSAWPGRLERFLHRGRWVVLDGAHNPQAAAALAAALAELEGEVAALVVGVSSDKDADGILRPWLGMARRFIATRAVHSPRALPPQRLAADWRALARAAGGLAEDAHAADYPSAALAAAVAATAPGETIVVAGSLFLVGEMRNLLQGAADEPFERWQ